MTSPYGENLKLRGNKTRSVHRSVRSPPTRRDALETPGFGVFLRPGSRRVCLVLEERPSSLPVGTLQPLAQQPRRSASAQGRRRPTAVAPSLDFPTLGRRRTSVPPLLAAVSPWFGPNLIRHLSPLTWTAAPHRHWPPGFNFPRPHAFLHVTQSLIRPPIPHRN